MDMLEKEIISQDYSEAVHELQGLYDQLFYKELKENINKMVNQFQITRTIYEKESQNTIDTIKGYLNVLSEDFQKLDKKQTNMVQDINKWFQTLNQIIMNGLKEQANTLEGQFLQQSKQVELLHKALEEWQKQWNERFESQENYYLSVEKQRNRIESQLMVLREEQKKQVESFDNKLVSIEQGVNSSIGVSVDRLKVETDSLSQQLLETKDGSTQEIATLRSQLVKSNRFFKITLLGLIGTQTIMIGIGLVYFLK
jgi:uncharacterized protein YoxC